MGVLVDVSRCLVRYALYILPVACVLLTIHLFLPVPRELFRKLLYAAAFTSTPVIMYLSTSYSRPCVVTVLVLLLFGLAAWPLLAIAEQVPGYSDLLVERGHHEVRRSLLKFFWGNATLVALCWGALGLPVETATSVLMWGFGDAAAALVGKRWGRHHAQLPLADQKKTWEGSGAMWAVSTLVGTVCLVANGMGVGKALVRAMVTALAGACAELITTGGNDTLSVPATNAFVLALLARLW